MVHGVTLFFALFNNLAIFIALVAVYSYLLVQFRGQRLFDRQIALGLSFGLFAIGCMYAKIPVYEGVIVDQRNAIVALSGAFGGPLSAALSACMAGAFRVYLGGAGALAGAIGVSLSAIAGIGLYLFSKRFNSLANAAVNALVTAIIILPGFLFIADIQTGWKLMKAMAVPYGSAIFLGIFLGGLLLRREEKRNEVEKLLRESEARYHMLFEYVPDGIVISDPEGHIIDANPKMCEMLGYTRKDLVERHVTDIVAPQEIKYIKPTLEQIKKEPDYFREWPLMRKDGSFISAEVKVTPMPDKNPLALVHDNTRRKELEAQLMQAQKIEAIGRLAGGIAHDLNNLLSPILGYAELLLLGATSAEKRRTMVKQIIKAGFKARDLVNQLLAFSRKQTLEYKPVNLNSTLMGFKELLRRTIREDIDIRIITPPDIRTINADAGQIEQVIMNLCVNAQDAMPDGGKLVLETAMIEIDDDYARRHSIMETGSYVMLAVSDTGSGMDESLRQQVFEPFFSTKGELGTGLGLSTVHGIVKQHEGHIWVYSEPGKGTTFKMLLPATDDLRQEHPQEKTSLIELKGSETILIVEDNETVRELTCDMLERQGYTVVPARSGVEALDLIDSHDGSIDLLLTDVIMPDVNGKELYVQITGKSPDTKVLYMSGYTNDVIDQRGVLDDGVKFIQKPFTIQGLAAKVREVIDQN